MGEGSMKPGHEHPRFSDTLVFDDANWPSIAKLLKYLSQYPAYEVVLPPARTLRPAG
jgi:hypothetical protein